MDFQVCVHCLGVVKQGESVVEDAGNETLIFCCPACQSIYHLIRDAGLDWFYQKRENWQPGRPEITRPVSSAFQVRVDGETSEVDVALSGLRCSACIWLIEKFIIKLDGVLAARVNYATHKARIRWDPERTDLQAILDRIASLGYMPSPFIGGDRIELLERERKSLLIRLATAAFFAFQIMLLSIVLYEGYFRTLNPWTQQVIGFVLWGLATPVIFYAGYPFIRNTFQGLRLGVVSMDTLVFLGSMSAYLYSVYSLSRNGDVYFDTAAMIVTLILLGRFLETGTRQKASQAISTLIGLQPSKARVLKKTNDGREKFVSVPVTSLVPGDIIEVIPGGSIPFDCVVMGGKSEVDESMLTGESIPVFKDPGTEVFAGTSNLDGRLLLNILRTGKETVLARIIQAVEDAQVSKAPIERLADRITVWFVPGILGVAAATFIFWRVYGLETSAALMNAVSVLVIACPCALGLATPMAILTGSEKAFREGLLIRGGEMLELLSATDMVIFDKTGTITAGKPVLTKIVPYAAVEDEVLKAAASLEQYSEHTIAKAICGAAGKQHLEPVLQFKALAGMGVEGLIKGQQAKLGSIGFLRRKDVFIKDNQETDFHKLSATGGTAVGLALDNKLIAWLCVNDRLRPEANQAVETLKETEYGVGLLTGDNTNSATAIAREAGIDKSNVFAETSPLNKADIIRKFQAQGKQVLMVGDGINDAPALAQADVGAAMGKATDIAIKSAGVVLIREDLNLIPRLLEISGRTFKTIKQNLFWAFSYNIVTVPLAAAGKIHPIISAGLMATSSLLVVANSLRLRR